jgi:hypothetical protein
MGFTSETAKKARQRKAGLHAARVNRRNGWACLQRARAMRSLNAMWRRRERLRAQLQEAHFVQWSPWGPRGAWMCTCGEHNVGEVLARQHLARAIA